MLHVLTCNRASAQIYGLSVANFSEICYKRPSLEWLQHIGPLSSWGCSEEKGVYGCVHSILE